MWEKKRDGKYQIPETAVTFSDPVTNDEHGAQAGVGELLGFTAENRVGPKRPH